MNTHSKISQQLQKLGIELPIAGAPAAAYVMANQIDHIVYLSGHIAKQNGAVWIGKLGQNLSTTYGRLAARSVAIDLIASLQSHLGNLDRV